MSLKKTESGAELLARLHARPDPKCIDPFIFGDVSTSSSSSPGGKLIEIFGPEGVGKTELALHCAAKACLPIESKCFKLNGLAAKVIIIDSDFKFSILRLAVILEKLIKYAVTMKVKYSTKDRGYGITKSESQNDGVCADKHFPCPINVGEAAKKERGGMIDKNSQCGDKSTKHADSDSDSKSAASRLEKFELNNSDIEGIVKESLGNVQVFKVKSSQQLLASLLSLESSVAEDPDYTLLIVDSISAFYLMDRVAEVDYAATGRKMTPICGAISRLVHKFGLTCLAISSAFYAGGKKIHLKNTRGGSSGSSSSANCDENEKSSWVNSEYLGKSWISARSKRIVLSRGEIVDDVGKFINHNHNHNHNQGEIDNVIHAFCALTKTKKRYVFEDDFMKDL